MPQPGANGCSRWPGRAHRGHSVGRTVGWCLAPVQTRPAIAQRMAAVAVSSRLCAVVEVDHPAPKTSFVQQFELHANILGEGWLASSHHDGGD